MAGEKRDNFPCIPEKRWWTLRKSFKESVPSDLSKFYVSNLLNISPQEAWDSVIRHMRMIGLIDDKGKPTPLAMRWTDDKKYKRVCVQIIKNTYPSELTQLFPNPMAPATVVAKWFKDVCLCESSLGKKCAEFYLMLLEGDPHRGKEVLRDPHLPFIEKMPQESSTAGPLADMKAPGDEFWQSSDQKARGETRQTALPPPTIHIDFHIHIDPETTPGKVDDLFRRIAKHLKSFQKG